MPQWKSSSNMKKQTRVYLSLVMLLLATPFVFAQTPTYIIERISPTATASDHEENGHTSITVPGRPTAETIADRMKRGAKVMIAVVTGANSSHMMSVVAFNETGLVVNESAGTDYHDIWLSDPALNRTWSFTLQDNNNESAIIYYWDTWREVIEQVSIFKNETAPAPRLVNHIRDDEDNEVIPDERMLNRYLHKIKKHRLDQ